MKRLPDTELTVMKALWDLGAHTSRAQLEQALAPFGWASNTVNTYLARLTDKGFAAAERQGKSNFYSPLVSREEYLAYDSRRVVEGLYGSPRNFVAALAQDGLEQEELEELQALLRQLQRGEKP